MSADVYWMAQPNSADVVREFESRRERYLTWLSSTGATRRALRALRTYYGYGPNGTADTSERGTSGDRGQFVEMAVNEFGGLLEQAYAQLVATKPAFQAIPKSGDYAARAQAAFADKLLASVDLDNHLEEKEDEATKAGLLCREAWVVLSWDKTAGEAQMVDGERVRHTGDVRSDVCLPWDVTFDVRARHKTDLQWIAFRRPVNRWDLIAEVAPTAEDMADPSIVERKRQLAAALRGVSSWESEADVSSVRSLLFGSTDADETDLVDVWEIRHPASPALPQGRRIRFVDATTVIEDSAAQGAGYPFQGLLAEYFEPSKVVGTAAGYSLAWDLLSLQEALDDVATAMSTSSAASGVSNIWVQGVGDGKTPSNLSVSALGSGMNLIESPTKPEPLHAIATDPQAIAFLEACRGWMQRRMGLNDVSLGDPTKGMPAQLAALLDAKVVQFWNQAVKSLSTMRARVRTGVLSLYQSFATAPRTAALVGKGEMLEMDEWTKDKLALVARVTVEPVSATSKTLAGKLATADLLLERGLINTPDEYLTVKSTGRLEKLTEFKDRNLLRLQQEKEMLQQGIGLPPVDAMATEEAMMADPDALPVFSTVEGEFIRPTVVDTPWLDIAEYAAVLASPAARNRPDVVEACTDAILYKVKMWRSMPPEIIAALGGFPPPPVGGEGLPPAEAMPDGEGPPGREGDMRPIEPPKPPPNPITGEQAEAPSDVTQPV